MGESHSKEPVTIEYFQKENKILNDQMSEMKKTLDGLLQAQTLEAALQNGVKGIVEMLEPLRSLRPERTKLTNDEAKVLKSIRATLKRPDFSDLETGLDLVQTATGEFPKGVAS